MLVDSSWKCHRCCLGAFRQLESLLSKTNKAVFMPEKTTDAAVFSLHLKNKLKVNQREKSKWKKKMKSFIPSGDIDRQP